MRIVGTGVSRAALAVSAAAGFSLLPADARAGGFEVREQSAHFQGMSFAGSAAGGSLSSMFWNPAAAGTAAKGLTSESVYSVILPDSEITVTSLTPVDPLPGADPTAEIGRDAIVPASYYAWRGDIDPRIVFALSINSQFGLGTEPDNPNWKGMFHSRTAKLVSFNASPTIAYEVMPGVILGGGVQFQYFDLKKLKVATPLAGNPSAAIEGDDFGVGFTAGILLKPAAGTSIGLGFRSSIDHDLTGSFSVVGQPGSLPVGAGVETPEKVTLSIEQALSRNLRVAGTVEWSNWSRLGVVPIANTGSPPVAVLDFQWHDGWYFALGGEYDYNDRLTLRAGGAYEISPIQNASERLLQLPDADRIWASIGASYKWNEQFTVDFAYSHIFVEDASIARLPASAAAPLLIGEAESSVDILSVSLKSRW